MTRETLMKKIAESTRTTDVARFLTIAVDNWLTGMLCAEELDLIEFAAETKARELAEKKNILPLEVHGERYYAQEMADKTIRLWSGHGKFIREYGTWQEVLNWANSLNGKVA